MNYKDSCVLFFTTVHAAYLVKAECEPRSFLSQLQAVVTYISVCIRTYRMLPHTAHILILYNIYRNYSTETVCVHNCMYFCCKGFIIILSWWSCETRSPDRNDLPNEVFTLTGYSASGRVQGTYTSHVCTYIHTECDIQCNTSRCTYKGSVGLRAVITSMTSAAMCIPL